MLYYIYMLIRAKSVFFFFLGIIALWFFVTERSILTPFIFGALFAYIFNPAVNFVSQKMHIPRKWAAAIMYILFMIVVLGATVVVSERIITESDDIHSFVDYLLKSARHQINNLPGWVKPTVYDFLLSIQRSQVVNSTSLFPFFPQALSQTLSFIIFLVSGYYFLQEGNGFVESMLARIPHNYKIDIEIILRKISSVLGSYLRGQIFLVFLMSLVTFILLSIMGVRFALFLALFSGFAEIIPIVGPIIAAAVAVLTVLLTGTIHFGLSPINGALILIVAYFILREVEDYFVIPQVMGKITKLSPFIIFFAVVVGGHIWGILGLILAVPAVAILKILLEYSLDQFSKKS